MDVSWSTSTFSPKIRSKWLWFSCVYKKPQYNALATEVRDGRGKVPVADYKVVKYVEEGNIGGNGSLEDLRRSCYSFCMCPGGQVHLQISNYCKWFSLLVNKSSISGCDFFGQIVSTSTDPSELCINGMSFSRRASKWANAALVVTVSKKDFDPFHLHGPLSGVAFQVLLSFFLIISYEFWNVTLHEYYSLCITYPWIATCFFEVFNVGSLS